ncbi:ABC transporter permease [Staphylospora marina]|uniref:ABC transporter permease n=1 Tax=Staphylospora marina TaxID=2490858 RepID=UPI000F5B8BDE|nr:ABC transporter permease [Staphylospora marina]
MMNVLSTEWIKNRRTSVWLLTCLIPAGLWGFLTVMIWYMFETGRPPEKVWAIAMETLSLFLGPVLFMGVPLFTAQTAQIEHQTGMWKQLLAMPVPKWQLYAGKFLWNFLFIQLSGLLMTLLLAGSVIMWNLGNEVSLRSLFLHGWVPFLLTTPLIAFHTWLSQVFEHQGVSTGAGAAGMILGPLFKEAGWWTPWGYLTTFMPGYGLPFQDSRVWLTGAVLTLVLLMAGGAHFFRWMSR